MMAARERVSSSRRRKAMASGLAGGAGAAEDLPFAVELWDLTRADVERVLARASSATLARAIYDAAQSEHIGRLITLSRDDIVLAQSE